MRQWFREFREFVKRGNVVDLAVGVVIGAAFGKVVSSFVGDVLMPPVGLLLGQVQFRNLKLILGGDPAAPVTLNYGAFVETIVDFLIVAFAVFLVVRTVNALQRQKQAAPSAAAPPGPSREAQLLAEIRDLLRAKGSASVGVDGVSGAG
jgi:large conductance mechanosensitive channel